MVLFVVHLWPRWSMFSLEDLYLVIVVICYAEWKQTWTVIGRLIKRKEENVVNHQPDEEVDLTAIREFVVFGGFWHVAGDWTGGNESRLHLVVCQSHTRLLQSCGRRNARGSQNVYFCFETLSSKPNFIISKHSSVDIAGDNEFAATKSHPNLGYFWSHRDSIFG